MAKRALGTTIGINGTLVGGLTSITAPERTADTIDTTTLDAANGYRDFIQGFKDGGEVQISGFYDTAYTGQSDINDAYEDGTEDTYIITFPASIGATLTFTGIITNLSMPGEANLDDPLGFECTIKVKGKPDLATTPSAGLSALVLTGTGGTLSPSFNAAINCYTFGGVSASSVTITPTAASHTIKLLVDGVYSQTITSGSASNSITMAIGSKKLSLICYEAGKTPKTYDIIVVKTT